MPIPLGVLAVAGAGGGVAGAYELLETQVLAGTAASVDFTNLNTNYGSIYQHLQVRVAARSSQTGSLVGLRIRLGVSSIDTAANYSHHQLYGMNNAVSSFGAGDVTFIFAAAIAGSSAPASAFGASVIDLLDPFETTKNKTSRALGGVAAGTGTDQSYIALESGSWRNTSAVGQLRVYPAFGNFEIGSRFSLYGMRSS